MGRMKELYMMHQQELDDRERIELLEREDAYLTGTRKQTKLTGASHNPKNNASDHREQKQGVRTTP